MVKWDLSPSTFLFFFCTTYSFNFSVWDVEKYGKGKCKSCFSSFLFKATISDKNCEKFSLSPLIQCWLQACSFLFSTGWFSFFRFGATLSQGEGEFCVFFSKWNFLRPFYESIASLNNLCHWFSQNW